MTRFSCYNSRPRIVQIGSNRHAVEQRDATDKGREVCPLCLPLMGAVVEGGLCS